MSVQRQGWEQVVHGADTPGDRLKVPLKTGRRIEYPGVVEQLSVQVDMVEPHPADQFQRVGHMELVFREDGGGGNGGPLFR